MQKWEYLSLIAHYNNKNQMWCASFINDKKIDDAEKKVALTERIRLLGQEGWEMVAEHLDPGVHQFDYFIQLFGETMKPVTYEGKTFTKNDLGDLMDYLGSNQWELVDTYSQVGQGIFGKFEGILYFKRLKETRIRRLQFKRPMS